MGQTSRPASLMGALALGWLVWAILEVRGALAAEGYLSLGYRYLAALVARDTVIQLLPLLVVGVPVVVLTVRLARRPRGLAALAVTLPLVFLAGPLIPTLNTALRSTIPGRPARAAVLALAVVAALAAGVWLGNALGRMALFRKLFEGGARLLDGLARVARALPGVRPLTRGVAVAIVGAALLLVLVGPRAVRPPRPAGPSVVVILIDTLRADHLGLYGYPRDTSPNLDGWAGGATVFEIAVAQASWTKPSVASLFTSLVPSVHATGSGTHVRREVIDGTLTMVPAPPDAPATSGQLPPGLLTVAEVFREAGYQTLGLVANSLVAADDGYGQGFESYRTLGDQEVTREAVAFLTASPRRPFFLYLHYMAPHAPYDPLPAHDLFTNGDVPIDIHGSATKDSINFTRTLTLSPAEVRSLINQYDGEIHQADAAAGTVLDALSEAGQSDETVVVLTADHGEEFMDHGMVWHESIHLYQELTRVPLVMAVPGGDRVARVSTPVMQIDIGPTLLDLAGIDIPNVMQGSSMAALLRGEPMEPRAAFSEGLDWGHVAAVWSDPRKLIFDREAPWLEVYDFRIDPGERRDLLSMEPGARGALLDSLAHYDARNRERAGQLIRSTGELSTEQMEKLRSLGYIQ